MASKADDNTGEDNPRPWVLVISVNETFTPAVIDIHHEHFFHTLARNNVEKKWAENIVTAMHYLTATPKPQAVLIVGRLLNPEYVTVIDWVLWYLRGGGRVIFCSHCLTLYDWEDLEVFLKRICVPWKPKCMTKSLAFSNPFFAHTNKINTQIPQYLKGDNMYFEDVDPADAVYLAAGFELSVVAPVILKRIADGWIGIVGVTTLGKALDNIIFSLCGIENANFYAKADGYDDEDDNDSVGRSE